MPGQTAPFIVTAGDRKSIGPLAFVPKSIGVDTITANFFVHFPDSGFGAWVNPFVSGAIVPAPVAAEMFRVSAVDTPSGVAAATAASGTAYCIAFEDYQTPNPGVPSAQAATGIAFPSLSRTPATYTFIPPVIQGYRGIMVFLNVTGGTGTVQIIIFVQDSQPGGTGLAPAVLIGNAVASPNNYTLTVYPGIQVVANAQASGVIIPYLNIQAIVATNPATFQADYYLIP